MRNRCDLTIEFDKSSYSAGDEVTGTVHVDVNKDCDCRSLVVECGWRTHGLGTPEKGSKQEEEIFSGQWRAGEKNSYPFRFALPNGPCTHDGEVVKMSWYVEARADIPWSIDPMASEDFLVGPPTRDVTAPYETGDPECRFNLSVDQRVPGVVTRRKSLIARWVMIIIFVVSAAILVSAFEWMLRWDEDALIFGGAAAIGLFLSTMVLIEEFRLWTRSKRLVHVEWGVSKTYLLPGEVFKAEISLPEEATADFEEMVAILVGMEEAHSGGGDDIRTDNHIFCNVRSENLPEPTLEETTFGIYRRHDFWMKIPDDAAPSFHAGCSEVIWKVDLQIKIKRLPDWKRTVPLEVHPEPVEELFPEPG